MRTILRTHTRCHATRNSWSRKRTAVLSLPPRARPWGRGGIGPPPPPSNKKDVVGLKSLLVSLSFGWCPLKGWGAYGLLTLFGWGSYAGRRRCACYGVLAQADGCRRLRLALEGGGNLGWRVGKDSNLRSRVWKPLPWASGLPTHCSVPRDRTWLHLG